MCFNLVISKSCYVEITEDRGHCPNTRRDNHFASWLQPAQAAGCSVVECTQADLEDNPIRRLATSEA